MIVQNAIDKVDDCSLCFDIAILALSSKPFIKMGGYSVFLRIKLVVTLGGFIIFARKKIRNLIFKIELHYFLMEDASILI